MTVVQLPTADPGLRDDLDDRIREVGHLKKMLFALDLETAVSDDTVLFAVVKLGEAIDGLLRAYNNEADPPPAA